MKSETLGLVLCAISTVSLSEVHIREALTFAPPTPSPNIPEALPFYLWKSYVFSSPKIARMISILVDEELQTNDLRQIEKQYL